VYIIHPCPVFYPPNGIKMMEVCRDMGERYTKECDRLSALMAECYEKRWGRWYLDEECKVLRTWLEVPIIDSPYRLIDNTQWVRESNTLGILSIPLNQLNKGWIERLKGNNWIGEQGLTDLEKAIKLLTNSKAGGKL
jgi:hypothetical protein